MKTTHSAPPRSIRSDKSIRHRKNRNQIVRRSLAGIIATFATAGWANAQSNDYWTQPAGGDWNTASNWSLNAIPGNAVFNLSSGSPYAVTLNASESVGGFTVENDNLTLNAGGDGNLYPQNFNISSDANQTTSLTYNGLANASNQGRIETVGNGSGYYCNVGGTSGPTFLTVNNAGFYCEQSFGGPTSVNFASGSTVVFNNVFAYLGGINVGGTTTFNKSSSQVGGFDVAGDGPAGAVLNFLNGTRITYPNTDSATISVGAPGQSGIVNIDGNGTFVNIDGRTYAGIQLGVSGGSATLNLSDGAAIQSMGDIVVGGQGTGVLNLLSGAFNIFGDIVVQNNGVLNLKGAQGSNGYYYYALQGALNLTSGATFDYSISNNNPPSIKYAYLELGGTLNVSLGNGFEPTAGESFAVFTQFTYGSGAFGEINLPPLNPGLAWDTSQLYTTGAISVIAVPEPTSVGLLTAGAIGLLLRRRARTHQTTNNIH